VDDLTRTKIVFLDLEPAKIIMENFRQFRVIWRPKSFAEASREEFRVSILEEILLQEWTTVHCNWSGPKVEPLPNIGGSIDSVYTIRR